MTILELHLGSVPPWLLPHAFAVLLLCRLLATCPVHQDHASSFGLVESARLLLESRADVNAQGGVFGTALQAASVRGHDQIVQ
jgi:hypothetical protein